MDINFSSINWLAVAAAVIAAFLIGGLWYGVIFGKQWVRLHKYTDEDVKAMTKTQARSFAIFIIADFIGAVVFSMFVDDLEIASLTGGLTLAFLLWLGFVVIEEAKQNAAHRKPLPAFAIDAGFSLVTLLAMGAIIGAWR